MVSTEEAAVYIVVIVEVLAGVWLAGLTYLMWRRHELARKEWRQQRSQWEEE